MPQAGFSGVVWGGAEQKVFGFTCRYTFGSGTVGPATHRPKRLAWVRQRPYLVAADSFRPDGPIVVCRTNPPIT